MDIEKLKTLAKLGLIEAYQACLEDEDYYYTNDESAEDDFFKLDLDEE